MVLHTGLRRRGYTAEILNTFCKDIGVTRNENVIQVRATKPIRITAHPQSHHHPSALTPCLSCVPWPYQYERLQSAARNVLNETAKRCLSVLDPIKVTILNLDAPLTFEVRSHTTHSPHDRRDKGRGLQVYYAVAVCPCVFAPQAPDFPFAPERGSHKVGGSI
jgi:glutamyl/glutaminyl-tRNA synthetase